MRKSLLLVLLQCNWTLACGAHLRESVSFEHLSQKLRGPFGALGVVLPATAGDGDSSDDSDDSDGIDDGSDGSDDGSDGNEGMEESEGRSCAGAAAPPAAEGNALASCSADDAAGGSAGAMLAADTSAEVLREPPNQGREGHPAA